MKIINKQCSCYMYLLIFEARAFLARKSSRVHGLSFESFNMKRRQQTMLFFLSTAE